MYQPLKLGWMILSILAFNALSAQSISDQLMNDDNISWVAHTVTEIEVNEMVLISYQNQDKLPQNDYSLAYLLLNQLHDMDIYTDPTLSVGVDDKSVYLGESGLKKDDILSWKVAQYIYYDKNDNKYYAKPYAIAPMGGKYNAEGEVIGDIPMFWLSIEHQTTASGDLSWTSQWSHHIDFNGIQHQKGDYTSCFAEVIKGGAANDFWRVIKGGNTPEQMSEDFFNSMSSIPSEEISKMKFVTNLSWDMKQHRFVAEEVAFAPLIEKYNAQGEVIDEVTLFYYFFK